MPPSDKIPLQVRDEVNLALTKVRGIGFSLRRLADAESHKPQADFYASAGALLEQAHEEIEAAMNGEEEAS